jgi:hypothetical protein
LTDLNGAVSSQNFDIIGCRLPKLRKADVLLCEESHLGVVADRCPNLKLLVLRPLTTETLSSIARMTLLGEFSNLVILDVLCAEIIPPFSKLHKLRELVLLTKHKLTKKWCSLLCKEVPNSVKFLSLYPTITPKSAKMLLRGSLQLTVLRLETNPNCFKKFCKVFSEPRENPKHMAVKAGNSFLWNGKLVKHPSYFRRRFLTYS